MATQQSAFVYITNTTDGNARIQLYHRNASNGTQGDCWSAAPGETVGPLTVYFETGIDVVWIEDYWWVYLAVKDGSTPGEYISGGSWLYPEWKECQLQHKDAGQKLTFSVNTSTFKINENSGACSDTMQYVGPYTPITNVFVLMLENRSFDNLFAMSGIPGIIAATADNFNSCDGKHYNVRKGAPVNMPTDPGHEFDDVVEQLAGSGACYRSGQPYPAVNNSGFAVNYATTTSEGPLPPTADIGDIMAAFDTPKQLPVIYQLATEFALCDQWFSSLPGPTWPNRFFVHGASSAGLDHSPSTAEMVDWETAGGFAYPHGSIYEALNKANIPWRIYNDNLNQFSDDPQNGSFSGEIPQVAALKGVNLWDVHSLADFAADLHSGYAYRYTFIEPNYGDVVSGSYAGGSSQHPMDDVYGGESLIKFVYEAIRNSPLWESSLLLITYDEHGGFYDSFKPDAAPAPSDGSPDTYNRYGFDFKQYGVRVPAVAVSPLISGGTVDHTLYDHASVLATVEKLFDLQPLTQRDAAANNLSHLLSRATPRLDCPVKLNDPVKSPPILKFRLSGEQRANIEQRPLPESGNLPGFLAIMLKTELELSSGSVEERAAIIEKVKNIKTRGDAKAYIESVKKKVVDVKAQLQALKNPKNVRKPTITQ